MRTHIWLRAETKTAEQRTALPPRFARQLMDAGYHLTVEASSQSAFRPAEYEEVGCHLVEEHSWKTQAPDDAVILGLKELEDGCEPLIHRHIHFAHVYKEQLGWEQTLGRYSAGSGTLYDLEFLVDDSGRRVAAFGHWAGFAGAAVALLAWANCSSHRLPVLGSIAPRQSQRSLIEEIRSTIEASPVQPKVLVIGALGRCGKGAIHLFNSVGIEVQEWDLAETGRGGPFEEILNVDILLNCVFVQQTIPPFLTLGMLHSVERKLSIICDVSCDPYGEYNPLPIYQECTTFADPTIKIIDTENPVHLIAIDHLPSLLPRESSEDFCAQLMPHLLELDKLTDLNAATVWHRAEKIFIEKTAKLSLGPGA